MTARRVYLPGYLLHEINRLDFCRGDPIYFYPNVAFTRLRFSLKPNDNGRFVCFGRSVPVLHNHPVSNLESRAVTIHILNRYIGQFSFSGHIKSLMAGYDGIDCNTACVFIDCRDFAGPVCRHPLLPAGHHDKIVNSLGRIHGHKVHELPVASCVKIRPAVITWADKHLAGFKLSAEFNRSHFPGQVLCEVRAPCGDFRIFRQGL